VGLSRTRLDRLLREGRLAIDRPSVYRLAGTPKTWRRDVLSACLQAFPGAAASGWSATVLHGLDGGRREPIEISTTRSIKARGDIRFHRVSRLPSEQIALIGGIPVTVVERTILDLAGHARRWEVDAAMDSALRKHLTSLDKLSGFLLAEARSGTAGVCLMRERLALRDPEATLPRSALEREVFEYLRVQQLPLPQLNYPLRDEDGFFALVDMIYPDQRLVLEVQSFAHHSSLASFNRDAERLSELVTRGFRVLEITLEQIRDRPHALRERLLRALRMPAT
jgi:hypothetical protein